MWLMKRSHGLGRDAHLAKLTLIAVLVRPRCLGKTSWNIVWPRRAMGPEDIALIIYIKANDCFPRAHSVHNLKSIIAGI